MPYKYLLAFTTLLSTTCSKKTNSSAPPTDPVKDSTFMNPLLSGGPDPWVLQKDTTYYYTNTTGNNVVLYSTGKMSDLKNAAISTLWSPPSAGLYSKDIWAPEIHYLQNKWYAYFAADDGINDNHRIYALECADADPMKGKWEFKGKIADTLNDKWAIDASVFDYKDQLYMVWSGWRGDINTQQVIYIARMKDPLTLDGQRILISAPSYDWEKSGAPPAVNEAPEALINNNGRLFLTYSASGCWTDSYSIGLLSLKEGGDPLNPADWEKSPAPVFVTASENGAFGPGHNAFFKSRDGRENWIIYHANSSSGQGCDDARNPRMQQFYWSDNGQPELRTPVKINAPLQKPGGE